MIPVTDLERLETAVGHALRTHDLTELALVGHGEISLALGWPAEAPEFVCKRLPPFGSDRACREYADVVGRYVAELRRRDVRVVDTEVIWFRRRDGRYIAFHVQPALDPDSLGIAILRGSEPSADHPLLRAVVDVVVRATGDGVGIDSQFTNWSWMDGEPWQLDLTTPFLTNEQGRPAFDMGPFLAALPSVVQPIVRREMTKMFHRWQTPRGSLLDVASNTIKLGLHEWVDALLEYANPKLDEPITSGEAMRTYRSDKRTWPVILQLERANRFWQERVRRRPYEFLLPEHTTYAAT